MSALTKKKKNENNNELLYETTENFTVTRNFTKKGKMLLVVMFWVIFIVIITRCTRYESERIVHKIYYAFLPVAHLAKNIKQWKWKGKNTIFWK